ncbi:MAG: hypothetical protein IPN88_18565 [Bacteroidetes bacterium]|nr:hypothetical protein [Bacteroidota bacterium]
MAKSPSVQWVNDVSLAGCNGESKAEVSDMQAMADKEGAKIKIEPWDYRFCVRKFAKKNMISIIMK